MLLLVVIAGLALMWVVLGLVAGIVNFSLFSLLIVRLYLRVGAPRDTRFAVAAVATGRLPGGARALTGRQRSGVLAVALFSATGFALLAFLAARNNQPVDLKGTSQPTMMRRVSPLFVAELPTPDRQHVALDQRSGSRARPAARSGR